MNSTYSTPKLSSAVMEQPRGSLLISSKAPAKSMSDIFLGIHKLANSSSARGHLTG